MKVWLYYRLSRDEDAELNSLTNQRNILVEYAKACRVQCRKSHRDLFCIMMERG
mgnify:CR=1 FL=1